MSRQGTESGEQKEYEKVRGQLNIFFCNSIYLMQGGASEKEEGMVPSIVSLAGRGSS